MEEKGYLPEQVFNANKCPILGFFFFLNALLERKKSKQWDLKQKEIG